MNSRSALKSRGVYSYDSKSGATSKMAFGSIRSQRRQYRCGGRSVKGRTGSTDEVSSSDLGVVVLSVDGSGTEEVLAGALETVMESTDEVGGHED